MPYPSGSTAWPGSLHYAWVRRLEFWPEYGEGGPLWERRGEGVDLSTLALSDDLRRRLVRWNAAYSDDKLPVEGAGDTEWLAQGANLLAEVRRALGPDHEVITHEDWWGEPGVPFDQPSA